MAWTCRAMARPQDTTMAALSRIGQAFLYLVEECWLRPGTRLPRLGRRGVTSTTARLPIFARTVRWRPVPPARHAEQARRAKPATIAEISAHWCIFSFRREWWHARGGIARTP